MLLLLLLMMMMTTSGLRLVDGIQNACATSTSTRVCCGGEAGTRRVPGAAIVADHVLRVGTAVLVYYPDLGARAILRYDALRVALHTVRSNDPH